MRVIVGIAIIAIGSDDMQLSTLCDDVMPVGNMEFRLDITSVRENGVGGNAKTGRDLFGVQA